MTVNDPYPSLDWLEHQWQVSADTVEKLGTWAEVTLRVKH